MIRILPAKLDETGSILFTSGFELSNKNGVVETRGQVYMFLKVVWDIFSSETCSVMYASILLNDPSSWRNDLRFGLCQILGSWCPYTKGLQIYRNLPWQYSFIKFIGTSRTYRWETTTSQQYLGYISGAVPRWWESW